MHRRLEPSVPALAQLTIGMPVRNGEQYIGEAITSILNQTFRDFELVIYDNASVDRTVDIADGFAQSDRRVRIVRHRENIGGARNFIHAAEHARTPLFCWAAHDDIREPRFLETLIGLLDQHPEASLACCAVRNIDPDGTATDVRPETLTLRSTNGMIASQRVRMYLREMPGTPFYGVFRTQALHNLLTLLKRLDHLSKNGPAILGVDMLFLAGFLTHHGLAITHEPLLHFRRGGISHDLSRYGSVREYLRQIRLFRTTLRQVTHSDDYGISERIRIRLARECALAHWLLSRDMRRMTMCYLRAAMPALEPVRARIAARSHPSLRRLRKRFKQLDRTGLRIVLFGAGKHTRRMYSAIAHAVRKHHSIVACCDDRADGCSRIGNIPVVFPSALAELNPDLVLVSSDTYERALFVRAREITPPSALVWAIYDQTLEALPGNSSKALTLSTNACISMTASESSRTAA